METKIIRKFIKNNNKRELTKKFEMKKLIFKYCLFNNSLNKNYILNLYYLQKFNKNSSISTINNICIQTGRGRGVVSFFKLSRLKLKELANFGLLPGLRKSS